MGSGACYATTNSVCPALTGSVSFTQCVPSPSSNCGASGGFNFDAIFNYVGQSICTETPGGACILSTCTPQMVFGGGDDAGNLTIAGGSIPTGRTVSNMGNGVYSDAAMGSWFTGGQTLTVSASGGMVPAFGPQPVTAPPFAELTSPQVPDAGVIVIPTSADLTLSWTAGQSGATWTITMGYETSDKSLECGWDASLGQGTIPQAMLGLLVAGGSGPATANYGQTMTTTFTAGMYDVTESAMTYSQRAVTFQ